MKNENTFALMNWKRAGWIVAIIIFAAVYFLNRNDIQFIRQDSFKLIPIAESGLELSSIIHLYNPNLLSSTIKRIHEQFLINGIVVGELDNEINQGIPGRKETEFPVSIRFSKEDYEKIMATIPIKDSIIVTITGEIVYNSFTSSGDVKVNQAYSIGQKQ